MTNNSQDVSATTPTPPAGEPGIDQVYRFLMYGISLPERAVRSSAAMVGGVLHESASLLVPQAFRDSKTYNTFVQQMLDVVSNDVGGVTRTGKPRLLSGMSAESDDPCCTEPESQGDNAVEPETDNPEIQNYVARKTVSTFIDLAGLATLHVSPLTVLAIVSDLAYGTQTYLHELADELKREGVIAENSTISSTADLLAAIGEASSETADAFDVPPLSVAGLRETIEKTSDQISRIDPTGVIPQSEIARLWTDMQAMAEKENVTVFEVSSAMTMYTLDQVNTVTRGALTTIRVTGNLLDRHLFEHYWQGLQRINDQGIYAMVAASSRPYIDAVWFNFSSNRPTITEDIVSGRMVGRIWTGVCDWMKRDGDQEKQ